MSQPPYGGGPYGGGQQYPQPGGFGPPGPYGAPGPYGTPPPPKRNLAPWLIVGGAVLLSGIGILLVVLFTRGDDPAGTEAAATPSAAASSSAEPSSGTGELPGGARVVEPTTENSGRFTGSDDVALRWVQAMADGDFQTAYDLSCTDVQQSAAAVDDGSGPAWALGTYFFEQTLSGSGFSEGTFDSLTYSPAADSDVASFTLQLETGDAFNLLVYVDSTLAVCDFI